MKAYTNYLYRSCLKKIMERDDTACKRMILCVSAVVAVSTASNEQTQDAPSQEVKHYCLSFSTVTDFRFGNVIYPSFVFCMQILTSPNSSSVRSWCDGSLDRSFMGWTHWAISHSSQCSTTGVTKAVICAILSIRVYHVHIKELLLLIDKSSLCGSSWFPFSLSKWSLTICLMPYNRR